MDIRQLKYFLTIAEEEQITGAAKKLHIAQPPLSHQLKLLENELGVQLVERGSRKIQLTEAGHILRNRAEQILELTDTAIKELKDFNEGIQGTLAIGTVSSSGATLFPERISKFHETYPQINFQIWEGNTYRILEILNSGLIEIGIVRTPFNMEAFESIELPKEPMVAAFSGDLLVAQDEYVLLDELINKPLIIYRRFEKLIADAFDEESLNPTVLCKTDDARSTLLWADAGIGIALVPESAIRLIGSTKLRYKKIKNPHLETKIAAIWMKNRHLSTAAKHFLEIFNS
ncbi:MAG: LysR family transcriptional regulator [Bacillota bacterium]|nr:LysR family transcriptional regulator [Bacillota bacterium]